METCYRHPDRETGVACSNCGRPICPDCMTTTSVGMRCPECARERTRVRQYRGGAVEAPTLTYVLIGANVAVALASLLSGGADASGIGSNSIQRDGALSRLTIDQGDVWRLVTSGFIHAGLPHLLFNMFSLWVLGSMLEPVVGRLRFALIYFASLLAGSFGALVAHPIGITVGASGAIFGLFGAAIIVLRTRGIDPMESGLAFWLGLNLLLTFTVSGISIGGHIGGLVGGTLAAVALYEVGPRLRLPFAASAAVCGLIAIAAVVGSIVVSDGSAPGLSPSACSTCARSSSPSTSRGPGREKYPAASTATTRLAPSARSRSA
jgi:membrane associated rhomboid family serine protease